MKRIVCFLLTLILLTSCTQNTDYTTDNESVSDTAENFASENIVEAETEKEPAVNEDGYLTGNGSRVPEETINKYPQLTNLPTLYITMNERTRAGLKAVSHDRYSKGVYTFVDGNAETSYYEQPMSIKGRGNWSWSFAQKPYTLKLDEAADFLGMGEAKKWVLVTVHSDKTMMHNYLTQELAQWVGLRGTCENDYIDVMVNNEYAGTYVLTEKIQINKNRIDVPKSKAVLFEIEMVYRHECDLCFTMKENKSHPENSVHLELLYYHGKDIDELSEEERRDARRTYRQFFLGVEKAIRSGSMEELEKYIDVDSFVNWYLVNELTRNYDSAFVTSCYCYINEQGKLYMGPCWDYDTCYGIQYSEYEGSRIQEAPWYNWLFKYNPPFVERVKERWTEMRKAGIAEWFETSIDETSERIAQSEKLEHELYPDSELLDVPFDRAVEYFKNWLNKRYEWMDKEFLLDD